MYSLMWFNTAKRKLPVPVAGVKDERIVIGESIGFVQFCFEQRIDRADDVGDNLWRCIVDPTFNAALRVIFSEEGFVEMDDRIFRMGLDDKSGSEHLCANVCQEVCNIVQNIDDVLPKVWGGDLVEELLQKRVLTGEAQRRQYAVRSLFRWEVYIVPRRDHTRGFAAYISAKPSGVSVVRSTSLKAENIR